MKVTLSEIPGMDDTSLVLHLEDIAANIFHPRNLGCIVTNALKAALPTYPDSDNPFSPANTHLHQITLPWDLGEIARIGDLIERSSRHSCWPWIGSTDRYGYPRYGGDETKRHVRNLLPWLIGRRQRGKLTMACGNPVCMNPYHLDPRRTT